MDEITQIVLSGASAHTLVAFRIDGTERDERRSGTVTAPYTWSLKGLTDGLVNLAELSSVRTPTMARRRKRTMAATDKLTLKAVPESAKKDITSKLTAKLTNVNGTTARVGVNVTFKGRRTDKSEFPIGAAPVATDVNGKALIDFPNPSPASANRVTVWAVVVPTGVGTAVEVNSEEVEIDFLRYPRGS